MIYFFIIIFEYMSESLIDKNTNIAHQINVLKNALADNIFMITREMQIIQKRIDDLTKQSKQLSDECDSLYDYIIRLNRINDADINDLTIEE